MPLNKGETMLQKIEKTGNTFQINIPSNLAEQCGIDGEHDISIRVCDNHIVIENADSSFSSLMTYWHEEDCRSEMFFG
jgi:antitoxin component of MazEF toxin-antitoxin module